MKPIPDETTPPEAAGPQDELPDEERWKHASIYAGAHIAEEDREEGLEETEDSGREEKRR
jgi:hypothetical protein